MPAYTDVVSGNCTISGPRAPSAPVSTVTATPTTVSAGSPGSFAVSFTVPTALSGAHANWISLASSEALGSIPNGVVTSTTGCLQSGTAGGGGAGSSTATGLTIELASTCNISAGSRVQVDFTASSPSAAGSFYFSVTTALNTTAAVSNSVVVGPSGPSLSAASHAFGVNTTYTISNVPVLNLSANQAAQDTVVLSAGVTRGTEALTFYSGAASGYTVVYTPPGGAAISDPVQSANAQGAQVTLTLADPIMTGGSLNVTALGTNPPAASSPQSNDITVGPGNGTPQTTNPVIFGTSVSNAAVSMSSLAPGSLATYTVSFKAGSGLSAGDYIALGESGGPTNFSTVTGVGVSTLLRAGTMPPSLRH